jgi:hypothetical protein
LFTKHDDEIKAYLGLGTILIIDIIITIGVITIFFGKANEIIAGIIGFIGAIIGGVITYVGVKETIKSRDEELFLEKASRKIYFLEDFINQLEKANYNLISLTVVTEESSENFRKEIIDHLKIIHNNLNKLKETMDYSETSILLFHIRGLEKYAMLSGLNPNRKVEYLNDCKEKTRDIMTLLLKNKDALIQTYYEIKHKRSVFR